MNTLGKIGLRRSLLHAGAWLALNSVLLVCGTSVAQAGMTEGLRAYDDAITADTTPALAKLTTVLTFDGTAGAPFDFGATSGSTTMEFILGGDPVTTGSSAFLAIGQNSTSSLRYEQWQNSGLLGFTRAGVADYLFDPPVPSPVAATHVTFVWDATSLTMSLYLDGVLTSSAVGVDATFAMPSGMGVLGNNAAGSEGMVGTIYRVTVYSGVLPDDTIKSHADSFLNARGPADAVNINYFVADPAEIQSPGSTVLSWDAPFATGLLLNGAPVTGTSVTVTPAVTTTYTLVATNEFSALSTMTKVVVNPQLDLYDSTIAADATSGLVPLATLTTKVELIGAGGEYFDFGATSGDTTMEFILEGDPVATGNSGFLAVGQNSSSSLRYEQWQNTHELGFTQGGVADYLFSPGVPSPTVATHVAFVWDSTAYSLKGYINGVPTAVVTGVSDQFGLPSGPGYLGANVTGDQPMVGRIWRVVVYSGIVPDAKLLQHATAFTSQLRPPIISSFTATPGEIIGQGSAKLQWQVQDATGLYLNGVDVTGTTELTVTPKLTTDYLLVASNSVTTVSAELRLLVTPLLDAYDAAIAADSTGGLVPLATLANMVTLTGSGPVPFDFGPVSGSASMEFILEGDPTVGADGYLVVGQDPNNSLRYAQIANTRQMGFTRIGVADYLFTPGVPSPTGATHVVYVWDAATLTMKLYTNGVLAGTMTDVSDLFAMPAGAGSIGSNPDGGEAMVGRIFRIVVYAGMLPETTIQNHAAAFENTAPSKPSISISVTGSQATLTLEGISGNHYQVHYRNSFSAADTWQVAQDIPSLSGTSLQVVDPTAITAGSHRFYRAVLIP